MFWLWVIIAILITTATGIISYMVGFTNGVTAYHRALLEGKNK